MNCSQRCTWALICSENPETFTEEWSHVDICVFICTCVCVCLRSIGRPLTFLYSSCLSSCSSAFGLSISTCSSEICSSFCLFASFCWTHRQERGSRGEAYRELKLSVFKGVSTPYFCIIHITPQRWSISRLEQESRAISWRDTAAAGTQRQTRRTQIHAETISSTFTARWEGEIVPVGQTRVWLHLKPLLLDWLVGYDPTLPPEKVEKTKCVRERKREKSSERWIQREEERKREKASHHTPPCTSRHWFIILISLISTAAPIFQMSFSNLCQTVWPFFLIQLMTSSVARRICNSDWVFYRHSSRHTRVFVCLSLSVSAQYFGGERLGALYTREKLDSLQNMCLQGTKP